MQKGAEKQGDPAGSLQGQGKEEFFWRGQFPLPPLEGLRPRPKLRRLWTGGGLIIGSSEAWCESGSASHSLDDLRQIFSPLFASVSFCIK